MHDNADMDDLVDLQRDGDDILSAQIRRADAGRDGISIRAGHQVDNCAFIGHLDALFVVERRQNLLRKIERILVALFIGQAWKRFQILEGHASPSGKRIIPPDEDMRSGGKEFRKDEVRFSERLFDDRLIERTQIDNAHLAAQMAHIHDRVIRLSLAEDELIGFAALRADKLDERAGCKGIMLCRYGKTLA